MLKLPPEVQAAAQKGLTGTVAEYVQEVNARWSPTDCYQAAAAIIDNLKLR